MTTQDERTASRRPIKARQWWPVERLATIAIRCGATANGISIASMVAAAVAGGALVASAFVAVPWRIGLLIAAAAGIQLRLLCNVLDGLVAVEGGQRTPTGPLFNEAPDRIADCLILIGAGYSVTVVGWGAVAGWLAAILAVLTAYVRAVGEGLGTSAFFDGPMAKQHRMAAITFASAGQAVELACGVAEPLNMPITLALVSAGCLVTIVRRLLRIASVLEARSADGGAR